eukprot:Amastigsp_a342608_128.p3 type:complete len:153 gc:universal Amastigsp_a342608_128:558-100(-)
MEPTSADSISPSFARWTTSSISTFSSEPASSSASGASSRTASFRARCSTRASASTCVTTRAGPAVQTCRRSSRPPTRFGWVRPTRTSGGSKNSSPTSRSASSTWRRWRVCSPKWRTRTSSNGGSTKRVTLQAGGAATRTASSATCQKSTSER